MALTKAGFPPRGGSILGPHPSSMENELVIPTTGSQSIARYHTKRSVLSCHWPRTYYSRYVHVSNLAHFGKHFHGTFWHAHFGIDPRNSTPVLKGDWCAISGTSGQNWQKPFSTNYGTFPIDPKLAGAVPLFCRTTDVPFLPKLGHWAKIGRNHFLPTMAHFQLIQNGRNSIPVL